MYTSNTSEQTIQKKPKEKLTCRGINFYLQIINFRVFNLEVTFGRRDMRRAVIVPPDTVSSWMKYRSWNTWPEPSPTHQGTLLIPRNPPASDSDAGRTPLSELDLSLSSHTPAKPCVFVHTPMGPPLRLRILLLSPSVGVPEAIVVLNDLCADWLVVNGRLNGWP